MSETISRLQGERRQIEDEYEDLRIKKESIASWESQISELIQW
jgi:serine/threonine-protein kinase MRCK